MTKAQMELNHAQYHEAMARARSADAESDWRSAIVGAISACDFADGMIQYASRHLDEKVGDLEAIEIILTLAPAAFDGHSLDCLATLKNTKRRMVKGLSYDLDTRLTLARTAMSAAHRAWDRMEVLGTMTKEALTLAMGEEKSICEELLRMWVRIGVLKIVPQGMRLANRPDSKVSAKCSRCGARMSGPKRQFWRFVTCPSCQAECDHVILDETEDSESGG